jgi:hypothetical protein
MKRNEPFRAQFRCFHFFTTFDLNGYHFLKTYKRFLREAVLVEQSSTAYLFDTLHVSFIPTIIMIEV